MNTYQAQLFLSEEKKSYNFGNNKHDLSTRDVFSLSIDNAKVCTVLIRRLYTFLFLYTS